MTFWAIVFFVIAAVAGVFAFGDTGVGSAAIAQVVFFVFLVIFVVWVIGWLMGRRRGFPP